VSDRPADAKGAVPPVGLELSDITAERRHLFQLAYRLLGTTADAEDVLQETYVRWYSLSPGQRDGIESPGAWLTTVASRICLDMLGSARSRRERYVGEWLPEPIPARTEPLYAAQSPSLLDPADQVSMDESMQMAFLIVLDAMTPAERVSFVLHDVFGYPFAEVAAIVGRTPAACRQLASSARRRLRAARTPPVPTRDQAAIIRAFKDAWASQDIEALLGLLDPQATAVADGGGHVSAETLPITGAHHIAQTLIGIAAATPDVSLVERAVNGQPGLVGVQDGIITTVMAFDVAIGAIRSIWVVRNPDKLQHWRTQSQHDD
jgi:RNA polymerase sigma-70 factor, ECF subfamily